MILKFSLWNGLTVKEDRLGDNKKQYYHVIFCTINSIYRIWSKLATLHSLYQMFLISEAGFIFPFTRRASFPLLVWACTCPAHLMAKETSYLCRWLTHAQNHHTKTQELSGCTSSRVVAADKGWAICGNSCQSLGAHISYPDVSNSLSSWVTSPLSCTDHALIPWPPYTHLTRLYKCNQ